ncbi:MAG TPA: glycoside hydrolase family 140 protein [Sedimentisphaerales bacterium]|nr:glycoside hydrolase family 140 protein [Sedimentisphaerales bacterium]
MNKKIKTTILLLLSSLIFTVSAVAEQPVFPIKVSKNRRYFIDQNNNPVFWLGTTQWQIFREYTLDEVRTTLEKVKGNGFVFVQAMLMGVGDGTKPNVYGEKPWINNDPLTPNEAYFKNVDSVIRIARENNMVFSVTLYHQRYRKYITLKNARAWAKWLAQRYKDVPNIVWSMTPEAKQEFVPVLRELAAGLHEGDGGCHLITFKPDPAPYSSSFIHNEDWLDFNSMQTWNGVKLIYPMVTKDYNLKPVKPVLMAEGAYEAGSEYGFNVTPLWIRRQAYYSYLAGAHHTYGHNDSWRVLPTWKKALDASGARQMGVLKKIFLGRKEWWYLVPDQSIFSSGGQTGGDVLNLAARHKNGEWIMVYLGSKSSFSINMNKITAGNKVNAFWIDPKKGDSVPIGGFPNTGVKHFSTPDEWEDAILILETSGD